MGKLPLNGMAISKSLYGFEKGVETDFSMVNPTDLHNILSAHPMGNCRRDAKNLAILLQNMQSGVYQPIKRF